MATYWLTWLHGQKHRDSEQIHSFLDIHLLTFGDGIIRSATWFGDDFLGVFDPLWAQFCNQRPSGPRSVVVSQLFEAELTTDSTTSGGMGLASHFFGLGWVPVAAIVWGLQLLIGVRWERSPFIPSWVSSCRLAVRSLELAESWIIVGSWFPYRISLPFTTDDQLLTDYEPWL